MIPQTIQKLKAITQPKIECFSMAKLIDALRNVFCTNFVSSLDVIRVCKPTGAKSRKDKTLCR